MQKETDYLIENFTVDQKKALETVLQSLKGLTVEQALEVRNVARVYITRSATL